MASDAQRTRGAAYMAEAEKALKKFSFFNKSQNYEDAQEAYTKAGNCFKVAKAWTEGGEAFTKAADMHLKLSNTYDAANACQEAANCYKAINPEDAIASFRKAAGYLTELGKFKQIGKIHQQIAEIYEKEANYDEAIENYVQAADFFMSDNNTSAAKDCKVKTATLLSTDRGSAEPSIENFSRAARIFEELGNAALENRLLQFHARGYFMNAICCYMAMGDEVAVSQKLDQYRTTDYTFGESRECKFLARLLEAWKKQDPAEFSNACTDYNSISAIDPWRTSLLLKAMRVIDGAHAAGEDVDLM